VIATVGAIANVDPLLDGQHGLDPAEFLVSYNVYEPLIRRDATGVIQPVLATSLPVRVNDDTWRFQLRQGVSFSNGVPFTSDAVVQTIKAALDKTFNSSLFDRLGPITGATAVDNYTVDIHTSGFDPILAARMALVYIVAPGSEGDMHALHVAPIGTGPYVLSSLSATGDTAILDRNPHYWGKAPGIPTVTVKEIEDTQTRLAALQAGEVDIITDVPPDLASSVPAVSTNSSIENSGIVLNALSGVTANPKVRLALNLAVDKQTMVTKLFSKYAAVSNCEYTSVGSTGYDTSLKPYPYDPAQARALLQAAGATGATIDLETASTYANGQEIVQSVASYWQQVGLKVHIRVSPFSDFVKDLFNGGKRPAALYVTAGDDLRDASQTDRFFETGLSLSAYSNPSLDALFAQAKTAHDPGQRVALLEQTQKFACDQALLVYMFNALFIDGHRTGVNMVPRQEGWIYFPEISD
jgi:peptide/nickel transport system substrate-binding protein